MTNYIIDAKNISLSEIFEIVKNKKKYLFQAWLFPILINLESF